MKSSEYATELIEEFKEIDNARERLQLMISIGEELKSSFPDDKKTDVYKVKGCASDVYIYVEKKDVSFFFYGWAESLIVKGYVVILLRLLSGLTKEEIEKSESLVIKVIKEAHLDESLVPSRANAFANIYDHMKKLVKTHH